MKYFAYMLGILGLMYFAFFFAGKVFAFEFSKSTNYLYGRIKVNNLILECPPPNPLQYEKIIPIIVTAKATTTLP